MYRDPIFALLTGRNAGGRGVVGEGKGRGSEELGGLDEYIRRAVPGSVRIRLATPLTNVAWTRADPVHPATNIHSA